MKSPSTLTILATPAFRTRWINPYTSQLYDGLHAAGIRVYESSVRRLLFKPGVDIWHIHWPENVLKSPSTLKATFKLLRLHLLLVCARLRGIRVVWTVHNLAPHESHHPRLERQLWRNFLPSVDAIINLNASGYSQTIARFPELAKRPHFVIAHGHFHGLYPDTISRGQARAQLGVGVANYVAAFVGQIRPYKNVPQLVQAFRKLQGDSYRLIIAGRSKSSVLRQSILDAGQRDSRIRTNLAYIESTEMQTYLRAADLIVLPYEDILNSGAAILALSFDRPVLVPDKGSLRELQDAVGKDWVFLYQGHLTDTVLREAMQWAKPYRQSRPNLKDFSWPGIIQATQQAYLAILNQPPPTLLLNK